MALNTYLTFDGECRQAFEFYRSVFGGDFAAFSTFADGPDDLPVAEADKNRVLHVSLPIGSSVLMGSDSSSFSPPLVVGNNVSLVIEAGSRAECDELFARLSAGGSVTMPLQKTFWGAYYGMWTDRFGIGWMVNHALSPEQPQ